MSIHILFNQDDLADRYESLEQGFRAMFKQLEALPPTQGTLEMRRQNLELIEAAHRGRLGARKAAIREQYVAGFRMSDNRAAG